MTFSERNQQTYTCTTCMYTYLSWSCDTINTAIFSSVRDSCGYMHVHVHVGYRYCTLVGTYTICTVIENHYTLGFSTNV